MKFLFLRPYLQEYKHLVRDYLADYLHVSTLEISHQQDDLQDQGQQQVELLAILGNQENELEQLMDSLNDPTTTAINP